MTEPTASRKASAKVAQVFGTHSAPPRSQARPTSGRYRQAPHASSAAAQPDHPRSSRPGSARRLRAWSETTKRAGQISPAPPRPRWRRQGTHQPGTAGREPAPPSRALPRAPGSRRPSRARVRARTRTPRLAQSMNVRSDRSAMTCGLRATATESTVPRSAALALSSSPRSATTTWAPLSRMAGSFLIGLPVLLLRKAGSRPGSYPRVGMLLLGLTGGYSRAGQPRTRPGMRLRRPAAPVPGPGPQTRAAQPPRVPRSFSSRAFLNSSRTGVRPACSASCSSSHSPTDSIRGITQLPR